MLRIIDTRWMAHLQEMDYLKTGIGLRAFGQRDPLVEYKNEAYNAFQNLTSSMYDDYLRTLLRLEIAAKPAPEGAPAGDAGMLFFHSTQPFLVDSVSSADTRARGPCLCVN